MASSHLPPDHGVAAGSIPVVAPRAGAPRHKVEKTTTTTTTGTAHAAHHTGGGGLAALAHLNSVRDMFALNAADSAGAAAVVDDGAEVEEEEREVASDTFRSTALISSREQVSILSKRASLRFEFFFLCFCFLFLFSRTFLSIRICCHRRRVSWLFVFVFPLFGFAVSFRACGIHGFRIQMAAFRGEF
jgi:hypothetical protein